ncbi:MAG: hypothetical protein P4M01_11385 [Acidobacteriota bacterium]|nr:hypothetical protein [Acidobacteriota bacterium]
MLALPFLLPQSLGNVTRMQQEEGYVYSPLVLAVAILWLTSEKERRGWRYLSLFSASLVAVYLGKSSLILAVAVLAALYIWRTARMRVALVIVLSAGLVVGAWGCRSLYASGRFTLGTSLDGLNLHKGNNERFLGDYPPPSEGGSIDHYDSELLSPEPCRDEWDCNDFHRAAALSFLRQHPSETATGWWRKFYVLTLSTKTYGSDLNTAKLSHIREIFTIAMAISRVLFWAAVVSALWLLGNKGRQARFLGVSFILIALALIAPYLVGFALTRHFSLLIFLAAELLGAALAHCDPTCVAAG